MKRKDNALPLAARYTYTVAWSEEDDTFVAKVAEFPSVAAHGSTDQAALRQIRTAVAFVLEDLHQAGQSIPKPFGEQRFSGRLNLRIPPFLHRNLTIEAARQHVSLNQLINLKLEGAAPLSLVDEEQEEYGKRKLPKRQAKRQ